MCICTDECIDSYHGRGVRKHGPLSTSQSLAPTTGPPGNSDTRHCVWNVRKRKRQAASRGPAECTWEP